MTTRRSHLKVTLVGDDLSAGAELALRRAASLPEPRGRVLHVLRAVRRGHADVRDEKAVEAARVALLERAEQVAGSAGAGGHRPRIHASVVEGTPFVEIIRRARAVEADLVVRVEVVRRVARERADLLVLGTHGRSGIAHALLGSTAEWLIRAAPCDVAVTRPARFTFEMP